VSAGAVAQRIESLYGAAGDDLVGDAGVLHVAAGWSAPSGEIFSMRIADNTPRSATDAFALGLARARSDAIVTTGAILRAEADLVHAPTGPNASDFADWRREILGRSEAPISVLLTRGGELDFAHPFFHCGQRVLVFSGERGAALLAESARGAGVEVIAHPAPALDTLLDHLAGPLGMGNVTIEAGARTTAGLYRDPLRVREWLLSLYLGAELPAELRRGRLPGPREVEALGLDLVSECEHREPSGDWLFRRYRRG
jgi:riboflavin biosynthesis pyrimidine reductase